VAKLKTVVASKHERFKWDLARCVQLLDPCIEVVGAAATSAEVLASITQLGPDLVLLDLNLQPVNALQLIPYIRRRCSGTAVVVISNEPVTDYREAALRAGALGYVDVLELTATLPLILDRIGRPGICYERSGRSGRSGWATEQPGAAERPDRPEQQPSACLRQQHLANLLKRLSTARRGSRQSPRQSSPAIHVYAVLALALFGACLWQAPHSHVESRLLFLLCFAGILMLELRRAPWAAGGTPIGRTTGAGRDVVFGWNGSDCVGRRG